KKLKDLMRLITEAENVLRAVPPRQKRPAAPKIDPGPIAARIADLYQRASQSSVTSDDISRAFSELEAVKPTVKQLEPIARQLGVTEKLKRQDLLKKMRQTVLDRKGMTDRVYA